MNQYFDQFVVPEALAPPISSIGLFGLPSDLLGGSALTPAHPVVADGNEDEAVERQEPSAQGSAQMVTVLESSTTVSMTNVQAGPSKDGAVPGGYADMDEFN